MPAQQKTPVKIFDAAVPFLIVLIFAAVFGPFFYYIIQPELQKYLPGGPSNYTAIKQLLDSRTTYRNDLKSLADFVAQSEAREQDPIALILPSSEDIPTLYALFEKLAKDVGVGLQVVDIASGGSDPQDAKEPIRKVRISLRFINVDYDSLKRLLTALETNIRLTTIESLAYDPVNQFASVSIFTYYFMQ